MEQCLVCFSSFIINKALGWKWGWLLHREGTRLSETVSPVLCCAVCSNEKQRSHHVTTWAAVARHTDVSVMFPICSPDVSISRCCFTPDSSSGSHLGARDEPSSNHIRHGEAITAGPFLVMVCSPNDRPTGCVHSGCVCLLSFAAIPMHR